jgi:hypothetical protein
MDKDFVPYQIALDMKSIGFDEPCLAFYNGKFLDSTQYDFDNCSMKDIGQCVLTPTFSQAFRWFREKYGLQITIHPDKWCEISKDGLVLKDTYNFDTYEEAELECLKKLIEIAKTNNKKL